MGAFILGTAGLGESGGGSTPSLDQVTDPTASKTFNLTSFSLTFSGASGTSAINLSEAGSGGINITNTGTGGLFIADTSTAGLNLSEDGGGNILIRSLVGSTGAGIQLENDAASGGITLLNNTTSSSGGGTAITDNSGVGITIDDASGAGGIYLISFKSPATHGWVSIDTIGSPTSNNNALNISVAATNGLYMNTHAGITQTAEAVGTLATMNGIVTTFTAVSDERLKIWTAYEGGLDEILRIIPIRYRWNEKGQELSGQHGDRDYIGFSAQNASAAIPEVIQSVTAEGFLSFEDRPIIAALVKAVQQLSARIVVLEARA